MMKRMKHIQRAAFLIFTAFAAFAALAQPVKKPSLPQEQNVSKSTPVSHSVGFIDKNRDGINDRFQDADGDGRNDLDGKPYKHKFEFRDKNKDKINDLWVDRDGDGVNDLAPRLKGKERHQAVRNVLDVDGDGRNDITGEKYDRAKHRWMGEKWGFWDEAKGKLQGRFIDEDGDGIDDRMKGFNGHMGQQPSGPQMQDTFIDEDGDGICDGRMDFIQRMGRCGSRSKNNSRSGGMNHH